MFISTILETGIGLTVVYYAAGLIVSFIASQISAVYEMRGRSLYRTLNEALANQLDNISAKKLVASLKLPSVPFFVRLFRKIRRVGETPKSLDNLPASALALALIDEVNKGRADIPAVTQIINAGLTNASDQIEKDAFQFRQAAQKNVETWLDNLMISGSAVYKENIRRVVIGISLLVTVGLNIDTIEIGRYFWSQPIARQLAAGQADEILKDSKDAQGNIDEQKYQTALSNLEYMKIPMWWPKDKSMKQYFGEMKAANIGLKITGWIISWAAISQGSSFWYDTLKKIKGYSSKPASESGESNA